MKVYTSSYPALSIPNESIWTHLLHTRFHQHPTTAAAYIDAETGKTLTRGEVKEITLSLAHGLLHEFPRAGGVQLAKGDVVMVLSPNSIAYPVMVLGGFAAGLKMTLVNSSYTAREIEHQWRDSRAKAVFVCPSLLPVLLGTFELMGVSLVEAKKRIIIADWGLQKHSEVPLDHIYMTQLLGNGSLVEEAQFPGDQANETALLCYSSGTTGKPKGVETMHRNLVSVVNVMDPVYPSFDIPNQAVIGVLPYFHVYGAVVLLLLPLFRGATMIVMPKFDPELFCKWIEKYQAHQALVVPPICLALAHHPATGKYNLRSLRSLISGAAPLGSSLVHKLHQRLLSVGADVAITQGYGLTETSPTTHLVPKEDWERKMGSCGKLVPNMEARLVLENGEDAKKGEAGELWIRGPVVMKEGHPLIPHPNSILSMVRLQGYLHNLDATRNSITEDRWFKTGDIAIIDEDDHYYIVDRLKELIKYKGFQVPPAELESVLLQHPQIVDAAVIGIYREADATELPRGYIVSSKALSPEERLSFARDVQKWIKNRVAKHKHLRGGVVVVDVIPKSAAGKILRRQLREQAKSEVLAETHSHKAKL